MLLVVSCGSSKKIKESTTIKKTTIESKESTKDSIVDSKETKIIKKDSIVNIEKTLPTENEIEFDLDDFETVEDFKSTVKSGETETTIEKKGSKVKITTKTQGHESTNTNVTKSELNEREKETKVTEENNNNKIEKEETRFEKFKRIVRIPLKYYLIILILLIIIFRKLIARLLIKFFPVLKVSRFILFILKKPLN